MVHLTFGFKISLDLGAKNDVEWAQLKAVEEDAKGKIAWVSWVNEMKAPVNQEQIREKVEQHADHEHEEIEEPNTKAPGIG